MANPAQLEQTDLAPSGSQPPAQPGEDYARVREAIAYLSEHWRDQPPLGDVAAHVGLSEAHFQRLFKRWAGLSPKEFVQAVTMDRARRLLKDSANVLDTAYEVGLSGPGRLHDLFVTHEAMTPGEYRARGRGLEIAYGFHPSPFGDALVMMTSRGLAGLAFADGEAEHQTVLEDMAARWPAAAYRQDPARTGQAAARIFDFHRWRADSPMNLVMIGTDFEIRVWRMLLRIPVGKATTYGDIASRLGAPKAARAVGSAVGRNPLSFVVPCHRVIGKSGALTGYHWGLNRKRAILGWEAGLAARAGEGARG